MQFRPKGRSDNCVSPRSTRARARTGGYFAGRDVEDGLAAGGAGLGVWVGRLRGRWWRWWGHGEERALVGFGVPD